MTERDQLNFRGRPFRRAEIGWPGSILVSICGCTLCLIGFLLLDVRFEHWFIVPVTLCGIVIGYDAADWVRGRVSLFDPVGIIGLLGAHFFFLAPLLHVYWNLWLRYVLPPPDWREWLGAMAVLNFFGIVLYKSTVALMTRRRAIPSPVCWRLARRRFPVILTFALILTGTLQIFVYARNGGVSGYIANYEKRFEGQEIVDTFEGQGWILMFSDGFPVIAMLSYVYWAGVRKATPSWSQVLFVITCYLVLSLLCGGLRGSRSNTIWNLFWAVGVIHLMVKPVTRAILR